MADPVMNLLFDLDGTLIDPRQGILACFEYALREFRLNVPEEALESFIGPPLKESFGALFGSADEERVEKAILLYRERFAAKGVFENRVYAGIPDALQRFCDDGFALFIATSKPTVFAQRIVEYFGFGRFFRAVYGSELSGANADKKDLLAHLLRAESLSAVDTVMIGDRSHDALGARANGIFPVGVLWGYGSRQELLSAGARLLCEEPRQLTRVIPFIKGLLSGDATMTDNLF
jgi:phosphoglycolate phosphatase